MIINETKVFIYLLIQFSQPYNHECFSSIFLRLNLQFQSISKIEDNIRLSNIIILNKSVPKLLQIINPLGPGIDNVCV